MLHETPSLAGIPLLGLLLCAGCSDPAEPFQPYGPPGGSPAVYGGGLWFSVFESPGDVPGYGAGATPGFESVREPRPVLGFKTFSDHWHCGVELVVDVTVQEDVITAVVGGLVTRPVPCTSQSFRAVSNQFLPVSEGDHTLRVEALGHVHEFLVRVDSVAIELIPGWPRLPGQALGGVTVHPEYRTFWRYPPRSLALYCRGGSIGRCDALASQLRSALDLTPHAFPSGGFVPYPGHHDMAFDQVRHFRYASEGDLVGVFGLLCTLVPGGADDGDDLAVVVLSWKGDVGWGPCQS